jgi:hypothetical protein
MLDFITAAASLVTALGIFLAFWQLKLTSRIAQLQFEDGLSREYREICTSIPADVFLGRKLTEEQHRELFDEFYRYIDLSNEQVALRVMNRINKSTWQSWGDGIKHNLQLPGVQKAWEEIKNATPLFKELRRAEASNFSEDPRSWHVRD